MLNQKDILDARDRIKPYVLKTPLLRQPALDSILGCEVYIKHEGLQITGSFKLRGATSKIMTLTKEQLECGVICASSGNHASGVACAAQRLGVKATIVMPVNANPVKIKTVKSFGGQIMLEGLLSSEREAKVSSLVEEENMVEIHPYADPLVASGQGTIGLEILEDLEDVTAVVIPIGGGGLISGVSTALKSSRPDIQVIGVEPENASRYSLSRKEGKCIKLDSVDTIADGTRTDKANPSNFEMIESHVDQIVTVEDKWIKEAMNLIASQAKLVAEPSSAMVMAAVLNGKLKFNEKDKVCFVLSGGNADPALVADVLLHSGDDK